MANIGEVIAALQAENDKQRQELQPRAGVVLEFGEHLQGIHGDPLVAKVKDAIAELFATLRSEAEVAAANAAEVKSQAFEAQGAYRKVAGVEYMGEITEGLTNITRDTQNTVRATGRYVNDAERNVIGALTRVLDELTADGQLTMDAATATFRQSEGVVQMSEMVMRRFGGDAGAIGQ